MSKTSTKINGLNVENITYKSPGNNLPKFVREAAGQGAKIILPPELFEGHYFCTAQDEGVFATAAPVETHPAVLAAREAGLNF